MIVIMSQQEALCKLSKALNMSEKDLSDILNKLELQIDVEHVWVSGYGGKDEYIRKSKILMECCCGCDIGPGGDYNGMDCSNCGRSVRCYECALGGGRGECAFS